MKQLVVTSLLVACNSSPPPASPSQPVADHGHEHHGEHHGQHQVSHGEHRFEDAARWSKIFDDPARDEWQRPDRVVELLALAPGMTVADIGAGTGYFEKRLSAGVGKSGKVIAIDTEPDMVRYLGERAARENTPNVEARQSTADDPKLAPASVDRILVVDTWHHIGSRGAYAKKLATALKPGGFVLVVDFTLETEKGPPPKHRLAPDAVVRDLTEGGLRTTVVDAGLPDQYTIKGAL